MTSARSARARSGFYAGWTFTATLPALGLIMAGGQAGALRLEVTSITGFREGRTQPRRGRAGAAGRRPGRDSLRP